MKQNNLFKLSPKNIEELNISKLLVFRRCPFEYKLRYLEKGSLKWEPKLDMNLGNFLHELVGLYFKNKIVHNEKQDIGRLFESKWEKEKIRFKEHQEDYHAKCKYIIDLFKRSPIVRTHPLASEYKFRKLIREDMYLTGRIDLVSKTDNNIQIWEFKLDEAELGFIDQEHKKFLQLIFYYYGIANAFGELPHNIGYYFFSSGKTVLLEVYPDILERGLQEIENILSEMKNTKEYIPKINNYCPSCGINKICPAYNK